MKRFCTNCGKELGEQEIFCTECGTKSDLPLSAGGTSKGISGISVGGSAVNKGEASGNLGIKIGIIVASALVILSAILPFVSVSAFGQSMSMSLLLADGELGEGVFLIIFGTLGIIFGALRIKIGALVAGILSFILCCYEMYNMAIIYEELGGLSGLISRGAGFYLLILSSIALLVLSILNFVFKK